MLTRLRRWRAYRRALAALLDGAEASGYRVSPAALERMKRDARERAGY